MHIAGHQDFVMSPSPVVTKKSLPPFHLLHGLSDKSVHSSNARDFGSLLSKRGYPATVKLFEGKTHTSPFVEDRFLGGRDVLIGYIIKVIHRRGAIVLAEGEEEDPEDATLCPETPNIVSPSLINFANVFNPF